MKRYFTNQVTLKSFLNFLNTFGSLTYLDNYNNKTECDVLFFCHDSDRGDQLQGRAYSRFLNSISDKLEEDGITCVHLSLPYSKLTNNAAAGNPSIYNRSYFKITLKCFIAKIFLKIGIKIFNPDKLNERVKLYHGIFGLLKPKYILCLGMPVELAIAAKAKNIPIAELLHGYGYAEVCWDYDKRSPDELPNYILCLDTTSKNTFSVLKQISVNVLKVKDPWLSLFWGEPDKNSIPEEWYFPGDNIYSENKTILITLQWGYAGEYEQFNGILENGLLPEKLLNIIQESGNSINWIIKPHPVQLRHNSFRFLQKWLENLSTQNKNCHWREFLHIPLPSIIQNIDGHITMSSSSAFDCAFFGVKTLFLCPTLKPGGFYQNWFRELFDPGYAELGSDESFDLRKWVQNIERFTPLYSQEDSVDCIELIKKEISCVH